MKSFNKATAAVVGAAIATVLVAIFPEPFSGTGVGEAFQVVVTALVVYFAPANT